ncbi:hypothetical protein C8F04DRAFT_1397072 [Mycena alexandri]|uniref:Secreted protein n=1 Tax=Mycena alexandri TaxID=1745969 RepID=A0AAD6SSJ2_9AGAR|nr:hypothetical protein C8F04DRAFT_1397072 [Mycena alexandri]
MFFSRKLAVLVAAAMVIASPMATPNVDCINGLVGQATTLNGQCQALAKATAPTKAQCDAIHVTGTSVAATIAKCTSILQGGVAPGECDTIPTTLTTTLGPQVDGSLTSIGASKAKFDSFGVKGQAATDVKGFDNQTHTYLDVLKVKCPAQAAKIAGDETLLTGLFTATEHALA